MWKIYEIKAFDTIIEKEINGYILAKDESEIYEYIPESLEIFHLKALSFLFSPKLNLNEHLLFVSYLKNLLSSGMNFITSLIFISENRDLSKKISSIAFMIRMNLEKGKNFAESIMNIDFLDYEIKEALSKPQNQEDLLRVLESLEKIYSMKISIQNEIKRNVSYPISILSFLTLLIIFIQIYVIPKIAELTNTEMKLFITPIIIFNIYSLIFISLILFKLNNKFENVILRIPMLKDLYKTKILLIFSQSMYLLLSSTKNIVLSLNKILNSTESNLLKEEILSIISLLESGRNLKEIFEDYHGEFPELKIYGLILSSNGDAKDVFRMLSENLNFRLKKFYQFMGKFSEPLLMLLVGTAILELAYELYVSILNQFGAFYP